MGEDILENATCFIIGAGDMTVTEIDRKEGDMCIAADGGYLYCKILGIEPDLVIGDMDSLDGDVRGEIDRMRREVPEKVRVLPAEKDDTDMLAAIKEGFAAGYRKFCLYGALGGRVEHTIANIQCLGYIKNHGAKGYLMDGNLMMTVIRDETARFQESMEGYLSLFCLGERAEGVTIRGMKYLLDGAVLTNDFPIGISNEFTGEQGSVTVEKGMLLIVITW